MSGTLYYSEAGVEVHCGRVEDVLATIDPRTVALLSADPPYGVNASTKNKSKGRSGKAQCNDFAAVEGDNRPFDPSQLLTFPRASIWGGNYFADKLPPSPSWLCWDKREGVLENDNADGEMAWTNLGGPLRIFRHMWAGMMKASEKDRGRVHPTQKPVALYSWLFAWRTKPGDLIVAPYAGSGPDVLAARNLGRRVIAIECVESYCAEIVKRLTMAPIFPAFAPPPIEASAVAPSLFDRVTP